MDILMGIITGVGLTGFILAVFSKKECVCGNTYRGIQCPFCKSLKEEE